MMKKSKIDPKDNHISFQCEIMAMVEKKLKEMKIECMRQMVEEGGWWRKAGFTSINCSSMTRMTS
ncbi:hypothetical protein ACSBR2_042740 [Camellia fascicularis]